MPGSLCSDWLGNHPSATDLETIFQEDDPSACLSDPSNDSRHWTCTYKQQHRWPIHR